MKVTLFWVAAVQKAREGHAGEDDQLLLAPTPLLAKTEAAAQIEAVRLVDAALPEGRRPLADELEVLVRPF